MGYQRGMSVGEVAKRSGLAISAIHFYERKGLIRSERDGANHRRYAGTVLRKIALIQVAKNLGIPLKEIASEMASLPHDTKISQQDWERLSRQWADKLTVRINQLHRLRQGLTDCIGCGCLSLDQCQLVNPDDRLAAAGPGPHYLEKDKSQFVTDISEAVSC